METSLQDNITTRSLLKGILATEGIRPRVGHQTKKSISGTPRSIMYDEKTPASPSRILRSQMKDRVRSSLGKSALENDSVKGSAKAKSRRKSGKRYFSNVVEELDKITPRTLLKKIIQNEDEVSMVVSQGSKAALEDRIKQKGTRKTRSSSLSNVNLSLPDLSSTEHLTVFRNTRNTRKKRRVDVSQFEREVDGKMLGNEDDAVHLDANDEDSSLESANISRSFRNHPAFSTEPRSTYKKALLRKPVKAFLVSLGDFEQGVEDKYRLVKGSQDCFIESVVEDKSSASAGKVAELNTELYLQPSLVQNSETNLKLTSKSLALSRKQKNEGEALLLETDTEDVRIADPLKPMSQSMETSEIIVEDAETARSIQKVEDAEQSKLNRSLPNSEALKNFEADKNLPKSVAKNISHMALSESILKYVQKRKDLRSSESNQHAQISMSKGDQTSMTYIVGENSGSFDSAQRLEKSSLKKDASHSKATKRVSKSELADENGSGFQSDGSKGRALFDIENDAEDALPRSSVVEDKHEINRISHVVENSKLNEENEKQHSKICVGEPSSRQEENVESLQGDHLESTVDDEVLSNRERVNKHPVLSALIDTPNYIRNARFAVPLNKPGVDKKVRKAKTLKKKKGVSAFKGSLVKQIFGLHSKMNVSKQTFTDVEACLEEYLDQLSGDLAAYTAHANRKTITGADMELLMKRQRLVTNTTSLNVLIERHLPLECRKLLIPCAMSGNKVFPCLPKM